MGNFKILPGERILNYTKHDPNDHLGSEAGFSELLITDANLRVEASAFPFTEEETLNDFYGRNYLDKKGDKVYIQPRFSEFIYEYIDSIQLLNPILKFKMEGRFLPEKKLLNLLMNLKKRYQMKSFISQMDSIFLQIMAGLVTDLQSLAMV